MACIHEMRDMDTHYIIDPGNNMAITNANSVKNSLQLGDHDSEIFTFEIPRYIDGHDMTLCDVVRVHFINTSTDKMDTSKDVYKVKDMHVDEEEPGFLVFTWKISGNATMYAGNLSFRILFACSDGNGGYSYKKWTSVFKDVYILDGFDNGEAVVSDYSDILEQWEKELFGAGDSVIADIEAASEAQKQAIEDKGAEVLASIPDDYTATHKMAEEGARTKADAIVQTAQGEVIVATDCSDDHVRGLKVFGKSTQDGVPSPDNPVELASVENPEVAVYGKNLLPYPYLHETVTKNGATFTVLEDGGVAGSGTPTDYADMWIYDGVPVAKHGVLAFSLQGTFQNIAGSIALYDENDNTLVSRSVYYANKPITISLDEYPKATRWLVLLKRSEVNVEMSGVAYPQLEIGDMSEYEKFKEPCTMNLPHTLHAIPVSSGGNYTDADGQQWIADEVDLERGVLVQRIFELNLTGNEEIQRDDNSNWAEGCYAVPTWSGGLNPDYVHGELMCTFLPNRTNDDLANDRYNIGIGTHGGSVLFVRFGADINTKELASEAWKGAIEAGGKVYVVLKKDVIIPLTAEEIKAFNALRTNYLTTTVLNDAGAWMEISYNADTKTFVVNNQTPATPEQIESAVNAYLEANPPSFDPLILPDQNTGKKYTLAVIDGKLTMSEVTS